METVIPVAEICLSNLAQRKLTSSPHSAAKKSCWDCNQLTNSFCHFFQR